MDEHQDFMKFRKLNWMNGTLDRQEIIIKQTEKRPHHPGLSQVG